MKQAILQDISKSFNIGFKKDQSFLARLVSFFSGREPKKKICVLKNISFDLERGEIVGLIGSNGSGKSTLLRIIAGIYKQDGGSIEANGKVVSLINLYVGLRQRLTMRENIFLVGSLFGLDYKEIVSKMDSIAKFSGLEKFLDTKIYQFSSGMVQRLIFSIAIFANPDILLLDEVFEMGDEEFKEKSAEKVRELAQKGCCVVIVSHDMDTIENFCDKTIWLNKGEIQKMGKFSEVVQEYLEYEKSI
jgi:ABC-type polysaccharide/polyol phosphate transport system ATPase subunit